MNKFFKQTAAYFKGQKSAGFCMDSLNLPSKVRKIKGAFFKNNGLVKKDIQANKKPNFDRYYDPKN